MRLVFFAMGKPNYTVKSVVKALNILSVFSFESPTLFPLEISKKLSLPMSTVHRLIKTLEMLGLLEQEPFTGRYHIGLKTFELGSLYFHQTSLRAEAFPLLQELARKTNETVHLSVLDEGEIVFIEKIDSSHGIGMLSRVGRRAPAHATASGKVLLAHLPEKEREGFLVRKKLKRCTERTVTAPQRLRGELIKVAAQGYSLDEEENERGIRCVAAPIWDHSGTVVASISVSGPAHRLTRGRILQDLVPQVKDTAGHISQRLGYQRTVH